MFCNLSTISYRISSILSDNQSTILKSHLFQPTQHSSFLIPHSQISSISKILRDVSAAISENRPLRVRSASPRVRLLGDHSRRGQSPSADRLLETYRREVERYIRRDPITYPDRTETPRGRSRERATTTETQRCSTDNDVYQDQYERLCESLRASNLKFLESIRSSREAERRLKVSCHMIQNGAEGHTEQAQREREDSQHGGGASSEFRAERYTTEGSDSTMDSTGGMRSRVVSTIVSNPADINDSARTSTARTLSDEDYNPSNRRAYFSNINFALNLTHVSCPSQFYPRFRRHLPNTTSASGPTPNPQTSAPGNLGVPRRPARQSLALHQCQPSSTEPSAFAGLSFSRAEFEQSIHRNVTRNMNLIPCAPASANPPIPFVAPSIHLDTSNIRRQPAPDPPICAGSSPDYLWNTANTRNWIYQNLVTNCGFPESHAYNIVMGWMGGGMTIRHLTFFGWQALTGCSYAGWFMWKRMLAS
ncbi:hypothetical protein BHYA_0001g00450 [Botrytis hyacinthi]|uniref:Uncharacterized protein n=1 Tax=Botrytis hyacinthi TaxID=278943 RepID=A0A4Z1H2H5_9HELO|nr:hypothetical protein BHYA_0001g00450 [Botrytis hyacinthi]